MIDVVFVFYNFATENPKIQFLWLLHRSNLENILNSEMTCYGHGDTNTISGKTADL